MNQKELDFRVEPLADHDRSGFRCESAPLERYLKEQAGQDARKNVAAPFVLLSSADQIAGFYTLSSTILRSDDLSPDLLKKLKLPRYPHLPATLLGRLARHSDFRGQGIGDLLLADALKRAYTTSRQIGSLAVIVDAKDERAVKFYRGFGFEPFVDAADKLFLRMDTIGKLYGGP